MTVVAGEGLFIAPDNGFNRWFVSLLENHRRSGAPLGRLPASGPRRPATRLPTWPRTWSRCLRRRSWAPWRGGRRRPWWPSWTGCDLERVDLVVAERCWRVGVGLRGALLALRRPLFRPALPERAHGGAPREVTAGLRELARRRRLRGLGGPGGGRGPHPGRPAPPVGA